METVSMKDLSKEVTTMETGTKNLFARMNSIQGELETVAKNLNVPTSKTKSYKAVSEVDIINAVKPLEEKHGVYSYPCERDIVESSQVTKTTQYGDQVNFFMRIKTVYRFVNVDNPSEFIDMVTYADGLDSGDKATGKAMTYADKYALMKAYKISTGDDPDKDPSEEYKKAKKDDPQQDNTGKLLMDFKECQRKLNELKVDIHSSEIVQWMKKHTGYEDQNASIDDIEKTKKLIAAYNTLIKAKEAQNG